MGLHFVPDNLNINFIGIRKISYAVSALLILIGIGALILKGGPRYGIDFSGGTTAQIRFEQAISDEDLKKSLEGSELPGLVVQQFGTDGKSYLLRISTMPENAGGMHKLLSDNLDAKLGGAKYEIQRMEMVGPKVGADLRAQAIEAMYYAILLISIYVSGRFEHRWFTAGLITCVLGGTMFGLGYLGFNKAILVGAAVILTLILCWKFKLIFALGAIISILHDLLITIGIYSIMDREFDLTTIAAFLTVVGYSLNDTIIIYDRIRENLINDIVSPLETIVNSSINQTISRTVLTSGTTLIAVLSLLIFGGGAIFDFALAVFIGVFVGTASSIFVASPVLLAFGADIKREDFRPKKDNRVRGADGRLAAQV
jgi:preprotein translocase subunit SecF